MGLFDAINELRNGKADWKKAAKTLAFLAFLAIVGVVGFTVGSGSSEIPLIGRPLLSYIVAIQIAVAISLLLSAYGLYKKAEWGRCLAQLSISLLLIWGLSVLFLGDFPSNIILYIQIIFFICLAGPLVYFGIKYIERLPRREAHSFPDQNALNEKYGHFHESLHNSLRVDNKQFKYSPSPFGLVGTFVLSMLLLMGGFVLSIFNVAGENNTMKRFPFEIVALFLLFFTLPTAYNYVSSPFERARKKIDSFTGGGSIFLFSGSWPFFRLMVYEDALEVRVFFQCYLIPYDRMEEPPTKKGFLSRLFLPGLLINSDVPNVPSKIRFAGFGMKKIVATVNEQRNKYLASTTDKENSPNSVS